MASGGARSRSGPPPDPNALTASGDWVTLPPARVGGLPSWPMPGMTERESALWAEHWELPQAILWERNRQHHLVALYCRRLAEAEELGSPVNLSTLVRQLADDLMLTTSGMLRARVKIAAGDDASAAGAPKGRTPGRKSARDRLKVVGGSDVEGA